MFCATEVLIPDLRKSECQLLAQLNGNRPDTDNVAAPFLVCVGLEKQLEHDASLSPAKVWTVRCKQVQFRLPCDFLVSKNLHITSCFPYPVSKSVVIL